MQTDDFALGRMENNKYAQTVRAVENTMGQYGITRPFSIEYKNLLNDLPKTPERRKGELYHLYI